MDFSEAFRTAVKHLTRKAKFFGFYEYRVVSESSGRTGITVAGDEVVTLQVVTIADGVPDLLSILKAHGSPATSEICRPSSRVLVGFKAGDPGQPYIAHYLASTPVKAYLDATDAIAIGPKLTPGSLVTIGSVSPQAIALAAPTVSAIQAVEQYSIAVSTFATAAGVAVPALAGAAATLAAAQIALSASLVSLLGSAPVGLTSGRVRSD